MASNPVRPTQMNERELVTVYRPDRRYQTGQRILHPDFGLGTVIQVRRYLIHVALDVDKNKPKDERVRRFLSAELTLRERMAANHFNYDDLDTLIDMDLEDLEESVALLAQDIAGDDPGDVSEVA